MNTTQEQILQNIKLKGPQTVSELAKSSTITKEGMRQHLEKLEKESFVQSISIKKGVGRPTILYSLAEKGLARFPDAHAGLAVQLLKSISEVLGKEALEQIIKDKQKTDLSRYSDALENQDSMEGKLENLSAIRTKEGYMAEWEKEEDSYSFIENHCPICVAATKCESFCESELQNIQKLLGEKVQVERTDHTVKGDRRCTYKIKEK